MVLDHRYNVAYWVDVLTEQEFIAAAYQYCAAKGKDHATIQWLYKLGLDYNKTEMSYQAFYNYMADREAPRQRHRPYRSWSRVCAGPYREGTKYRKNTSHGKKEESQKAIWREVSGITRDKSKPHYRSSARKATARKAANGAYRKWCKQVLHKGNYDAFANSDTDWKEFHDPWDWD